MPAAALAGASIWHLIRIDIVELEGIEPSSKRCDRTLSTCLFQPSVFV